MSSSSESHGTHDLNAGGLPSEAEVFRTMHNLLEGIAQIAENHGFKRGDDLSVWLAKSLPSTTKGSPMETAPQDRPILVWWPIVLIDEETGTLSDEIVDGAWLVTEWNGGHWLEPDCLNGLNSVAFDDDREYAEYPQSWRELPPDITISTAEADGTKPS